MENTIRANFAGLRDFASLLIGFLIGGLAGVAVAMLFAPQSGELTRTQLRIKSAELQGRATDTLEELVIISQFDNRRILARAGGKAENRLY